MSVKKNNVTPTRKCGKYMYDKTNRNTCDCFQVMHPVIICCEEPFKALMKRNGAMRFLVSLENPHS